MEPPTEPRVRTAVHCVETAVRLVITWALRVSLPLVFANALLRAFPYRATVAGVPFRVQATLFTHTGFSADTTVGSWEFLHVDGLPVGIRLSPVDVDVLRLSKIANPDTADFADDLKNGFAHQVPYIAAWLVGLAVLGIGLGLLVAATLNMALRYLKGLPRRERELRLRAQQLSAAALVTVVVAGYGVFSFNSDWTKQSRLTGTLGAVQLFPSQLEQFYNQQAKAYNVLGAVVGIQAALQAKIDASHTPDTAFNVLYISDMHLAAEYPLVLQYVKNFDVKLVVNTGDESEFGTTAELTEGYLTELRAVTALAPMLWVAGNHDSPDTIDVMRRVPGVTVLGTKLRMPDGSYTVQGSRIRAYGLGIGGLPDPRVYAASGVYGSDVDKDTDQLEQRSVDDALAHASTDTYFDIFATHEPAAASELGTKLGDRVRQLNSGHTHAQNSTGQIQQQGLINLVEGSTGAGGLDNINRKSAPPVEFSIESVSHTCQFTKLLRFQLADPELPTDASAVSVGDNVTVSTVYLTPQKISSSRDCSVDQGLGSVKTLDAPQDDATDVQR